MPSKRPTINDFLVGAPAPTVGSVMERRLGTTRGTSLPPLQVEPQKRGEMRSFMTNVRDTPNAIAHEPTRSDASNSKMTRSLEDVWMKGMYSMPAEMREIDPTVVNHVNPTTGKMLVPRYVPERFERGRVQQPHVTLIEVDKDAFNHGEGGFMTPSERRHQHDLTVNCKLGEEALKAAYRARNRLVRNCQKNYPHGVANVMESPFSTEGQLASVYAGNREDIAYQQRIASRISKGHGIQREGAMRALLAPDLHPDQPVAATRREM